MPDPNPSVLRALADRVEREEPSRELEAAIHAAVTGYPVTFMTMLPHYTTSRDAAATLVPEECGVEIHGYWLKKPGRWWSVALSWGTAGKYAEAVDVASEPRAVSAAALRALAAIAEGES